MNKLLVIFIVCGFSQNLIAGTCVSLLAEQVAPVPVSKVVQVKVQAKAPSPTLTAMSVSTAVQSMHARDGSDSLSSVRRSKSPAQQQKALPQPPSHPYPPRSGIYAPKPQEHADRG
jgi:hypothetical protein